MKPVDLDAISLIVQRALEQRRLRLSWAHEKQRCAAEFGLHQLIGECPAVQRARSLVQRICTVGAAAPAKPPNILITGETGTGKDLLARAFHYEGPRRDGPFVQVNCAALPEALAESELFGHLRGAFTDARGNKRGLFEVADGGTLFLDEIHLLSPGVQAKLLLAIEQGRIRPVGAVEDRGVDTHFIAAMNRDPEKLVAEGRLREDLYHRLRVIHVHLPPLRERGRDMELLARHFVSLHCTRIGMPSARLGPDTLAAMYRYSWPGNVRELCNRIQSAVLLGNGEITPDFLPESGQRQAARVFPERHNGAFDFGNGPIPLESVEYGLICLALEETRGNVSRAAELLCISRDTMRYRMEKHGIHPHGRGNVQEPREQTAHGT